MVTRGALSHAGLSPNFGKVPPLGFPRQTASHFAPKPFSSDAGLTFETKHSERAVSSSLWTVQVEDLEPVPVDYPLERTHRKIGSASAQEIVSRISSALQLFSVEAVYNNEQAKAKCKTTDLVDFRIQLYAAAERSVVVELQRRNGSAQSFLRYSRAILDAAEGIQVSTQSVVKKELPYMTIPVSQMKCLQSVYRSDDEIESTSAMNGVLSQLRSNSKGSQILALENLCCLCDVSKTNGKVALRVSKCIILGEEQFEIREEILSVLQRYSVDTSSDNDMHGSMLLGLVLTILANASSLCCQDASLGNALENQRWVSDVLVPFLLNQLRHVEYSPSNAYRSATCLSSLLDASESIRHLLIHGGGIDTLRTAHRYGCSRHALLEDTTRLCLITLGVL